MALINGVEINGSVSNRSPFQSPWRTHAAKPIACCANRVCALHSSRGAAAEESSSDWVPITEFTFLRERKCRGISPRLRELGYVEGWSIFIDYRRAEGTPDQFPALAGELSFVFPVVDGFDSD
jgi:hypothetical protein